MIADYMLEFEQFLSSYQVMNDSNTKMLPISSVESPALRNKLVIKKIVQLSTQLTIIINCQIYLACLGERFYGKYL